MFDRSTLISFIESYPLYKKFRTLLPHYAGHIVPDVVELNCPICRQNRTFHSRHNFGKGNELRDIKVESAVYNFGYICTHCNKGFYQFFVEANVDESDSKKSWLQKVGQIPAWLPAIPKDIEDELGEDAELLKKALRNLNEGYGIGACAYLRRLIEKHINPLLELLHDVKQDQGAKPEELALIKDAIKAKDFTTKTKFASEIAPSSVMVKGHNPLKEIHERLSVGLHTLDEETATTYAIAIKDALEFIIRRLRREHEERKEYSQKLKAVKNLPIT